MITRHSAPSALLLAILAVGCQAVDRNNDHDDHDDHGDAKGAHAEGTEKKGDAHDDDEGVVHLSPDAIARNGIRIDVAKGGRLGAGVEVPAEIALAPDQIAHVTLLVPGRVSEVRKTLGDKVKAGDIIALVESAELGAAQSARTQAEAEVNVARKAFERQKELKTAGIGTQRTWDEAEAALQRAEADLAAANQRTRVYGGAGTGTTVSLRAPLDGEIVERHASVGEVTEVGGEPLFVIANLSTVVVEARVYERDVASAVVGAPLRLTLQAYPGESWEAKLSYVAPRLDEKSRTVTVRAVLKSDARLKPGLFGTVTLLSSAVGEAVPRAIVPEGAVQRLPSGDVVFVPVTDAGDNDKGKEIELKPVPVVVSGRRLGEVELSSGLEPGAPVVVSGAFVVKSELLRAGLGEGHAH